MCFESSPLGPVNPTGGRYQYLGLYDLAKGEVCSTSDTTFGNPTGSQYDEIVIGKSLPETLSNLFPPKHPTPSEQVKVKHQFFATINGPGYPSDHDSRAPAGFMHPGMWIVALEDGTYAKSEPWPENRGSPLNLDQYGFGKIDNTLDSIVERTAHNQEVSLSTVLFDRSVPASV